MVSTAEKPVELTITVLTLPSLAERLKAKIGGLPLVMNRVSEVCGPGDQKKSHRERLERAVALGVPNAEEIRDSYDGRGPEQVELTISAGAGRKGELLDNLTITIKPSDADVAQEAMVESIAEAEDERILEALKERLHDERFVRMVTEIQRDAALAGRDRLLREKLKLPGEDRQDAEALGKKED